MPEIPKSHIAVLQIVRDAVRENVFDRNGVCLKTVQQFLYAAGRIRVSHGRACLRLRMALDQFRKSPESTMAMAQQNLQCLPRVAVIDHDLQCRARPAAKTKLFDDPLRMRRVMYDAERIDQIVPTLRQERSEMFRVALVESNIRET